MALVLSITGLLLGAVATERLNAALLLREQQTELARMADFARVGAMGMELAHEISQPLSTVATYLHSARRLLQSSAAGGPIMDALPWRAGTAAQSLEAKAAPARSERPARM